MFVGLSAVKVENMGSEEPLGETTKSGALVRKIAEVLPRESVYYTNLVKCLPLNGAKIRYPSHREMDACVENLEYELKVIKPMRLVLLGRQVSDFVSKKLGISLYHKKHGSFPVGIFGFTRVMAAHHPSYTLVYRRRNIDTYLAEIRDFITDAETGNSVDHIQLSPPSKLHCST